MVLNYPRDLTEEQNLLLNSIRGMLEEYGENYWAKLDESHLYPEEFVKKFTELGLFNVPIPVEYGGAGLGIREASLILEEINASGGNSQPFHGQYYMSWLLSKFASVEMKKKLFPALGSGKIRMQSMGLTEPDAGSNTPEIKTFAKKDGNNYIINGQKIFTSRIEESDWILIVARTKRYDDVQKKTDGISLFLLGPEQKKEIEYTRIKTMFNSQTYQVFINNITVPEENLIGEENRGFGYLMHVLNPERILIASESIGDMRWFIEKSAGYASSRVVFDRPIGENQGVQFPIADIYAKMLSVSALRWQAASLYDSGGDIKIVGELANSAKYLASEYAWQAANVAMDTYGGYGVAVDTGIERKFREARLYKVAPITNNLVLSYLGHNVLNMPKSY
ncbi:MULTISPECIES: acyl-CoA dehydrogenase family protein [Acidiplasma]|jgi:alkylation response protein AidB-like acyl-CoA dehydrogenase|uniref:Acyl-CoA dehydrogenase n=2 Tax=Acidiplasma TaxID=507753 RepID=A0A0Q0RUW4_9ARCH|nr:MULTISPECIES: acyl-CoA dehydrogenase family protein [Acidiplasma]KJE49978.1 acyl-CoA dehydrogenase [Acidiplasma sp. MBA-1]KQB33771.1 acyl-CoA dehydrogenase [Acidiplasma cupricumulans]WMT55177.1 MAG: acyl-CoA dehydrogenase family protein [Acidiplasma sp.]